MNETLLDQWHRENGAVELPPSVLRQCMIGAVRGTVLGIALVAILAVLAWLGFH